MNALSAFALIASLLLLGCGKKTPAPAALTESAPTNSATPDAPIEGFVDQFMTAQLQIFIREKGRLPTDFNEFASARMDSVPRAPEGMRFVVDPATQQVKLVKR